MRWLLLLLLFPAAGAQALHVEDAAGDVATPVPGTLGSFDLNGLGIEPRNQTSFQAPYAWDVGIHGGSLDVAGSQLERTVRLHWSQGGQQGVLEHESMCLSLPPACHGGPLDMDPCGASFWAEMVWIQPAGAQQMDRVPDDGWVVMPCLPQDSAANATDPPDVASEPLEEAPNPWWLVLAALWMAGRRA